ncbi:MAG: sigma-70 family polymerase sigma factor [Paenibacillaceae bacterium]|jgi:RNA polymerase sigma-B factor|nr:sigma-70 family polymerase sigma factor [Paenibacillaceae bacterium]
MTLQPSEPNAQPRAEELLAAYRETRNNELAEVLLKHYEGIVRMAAAKLSRNRKDMFEDLFQVGQLSMFRLFETYDPTFAIPFEAYAMKSIVGHMKNYLRDKSWYVQVPRRIKEKGHALQKAIDELSVKLERSPQVGEIAAYLELSEEETIQILVGWDCYQSLSLDTPLFAEETGATLADIIQEERDDYRLLVQRLDLEQAMENLKPEERDVLDMAYSQGKSQRQIAEELGVSQMSISRIQRKAMDKLRTLLTDPGMEGI